MSVETLTQEVARLTSVIEELITHHHAQMSSLHAKLFEISTDINKEAVIRQKIEDKKFLDKINNLGRYSASPDFRKIEETLF